MIKKRVDRHFVHVVIVQSGGTDDHLQTTAVDGDAGDLRVHRVDESPVPLAILLTEQAILEGNDCHRWSNGKDEIRLRRE